MADRDALLREAERRLNEAIRERTPPSADGTPSLDARLDPVPETLEMATTSVASLLASLRGQNDFIREWREVRTPEDHAAATGLDVVADPEAWAAFLRSERGKTDDAFSFDALAFSPLIYPQDASAYSASLSYSGGQATTGLSKLAFNTRAPTAGDTLTFDQWASMVETIVMWRQTRFIGIGPPSHGIHNAVYEFRAWPGWMAWLPVQIDPSALPETAIVTSIGGGTLVAAQDRTIRSDRPDDLERSAALEMALVELDVLPLRRNLQ
ncbi:MAG: hypothetical protein AAF714_11775 [Pseudomonadota bacterium]